MSRIQQNIYVGSIREKGGKSFVIYQQKEDKKVDFYSGKEYHDSLNEGPQIGHVVAYYQEYEHRSLKDCLSFFGTFIDEAVNKILNDFSQMRVGYFESKDAFYEAIDAREFVEQQQFYEEAPKKYVKKM